jgi:hypothetical protein
MAVWKMQEVRRAQNFLGTNLKAQLKMLLACIYTIVVNYVSLDPYYSTVTQRVQLFRHVPCTQRNRAYCSLRIDRYSTHTLMNDQWNISHTMDVPTHRDSAAGAPRHPTAIQCSIPCRQGRHHEEEPAACVSGGSHVHTTATAHQTTPKEMVKNKTKSENRQREAPSHHDHASRPVPH